MKTVCDINKCAGCMACIDICPTGSVRIVDSIMEYNAVIDEAKCIKCGACHRICQYNNTPELTYPILWREGWANDDDIRAKSSSGGLATAIEKSFVKNKGQVCSCSFDNGNIGFSFAKTEEEVDKFTGSKYVKSNMKGTYKKILNKLKNKENILFVGLPCQVAALRNYVGNRENLYTIDLICHGTPSPVVLERFLNDYKLSIADTNDIKFRNKNDFYLQFNKKRFSVPTVVDQYLRTFLDSTSYTENCYECKYAQIERVSDISLGDSWGSSLPQNEQNKGVSLILCQSEKGKELLNETNLDLFDVDLEASVANNHQLEYPSMKPEYRSKFMKAICDERKFNESFFISYTTRYLKNTIKTILYKLNIKR